MKGMFAGGACLLACNLAFAQTPSQTPQPQTPPTSPPAAQAGGTSTEQQVTIVGCVQREEDYRRAHNLGRGGAAGTGVGVGNEYVLVDASPVGTTAGTPPAAAAPGAATGTAGTTGSTDQAYELTGSGEGKAGEYVGKRVEIVGKLKPAETGPAGPTGGATAGAPPTGVDVMSKDLKLREVEVTSVRETTGTCPAPAR